MEWTQGSSHPKTSLRSGLPFVTEDEKPKQPQKAKEVHHTKEPSKAPQASGNSKTGTSAGAKTGGAPKWFMAGRK